MKKSVAKIIETKDMAKKVNPLDLSSDQDLTIGLVNLVAIEQCAPDTEIADMVRDIRRNLMMAMVQKSPVGMGVYEKAEQLLANVATMIDVGNKKMDSGDKNQAYSAFDTAYEAYVMFWGLLYGLDDCEKSI